MQTTTVHRVAVVGLLLATAACSGGSNSASNATVTNNTSNAEVAPPVTSSLAPPTTTEATTIPATTPPTTTTTITTTTLPATTVPDPCAEFRAFGPYGRMLAVESGTAPGDPACADDVTKAQAAVSVFRTTERTFPHGYADDSDNWVVDFACDTSGGFFRLKNPFDQPVIWWGSGWVQTEAEEVTGVYPFFGVVSQPGEEIAVKPLTGFGGPNTKTCGMKFDAFLAPAGANAADAGLIPAPADDPQASDDPAVWFPALMDYAKPPTQASMINEIEDVHSPDVVLAPIDKGDADATATTAPAAESVTKFCQEVPVSQPGGTQGEMTMILYASAGGGSEPYQNIQQNMFRRGADGRWRFLGSSHTLYEFPDPKPEARCDFPLYPLHDYNAPAQ